MDAAAVAKECDICTHPFLVMGFEIRLRGICIRIVPVLS